MKRLVIVAIMAAFLLGTVGAAQAAKLTISGGDFRVHGNYVDNPNFDKDDDSDPLNFYQRFRTSFNFVANENLKGVVQLQFGGEGSDSLWGRGGDAGVSLGGAREVDIRQAYLEFLIPNTQATVKAGYQWWALPNTLGSHIFDARSPAFVVSTPINDMIGVTLGYSRSNTTNNGSISIEKTSMDHFLAIVPITMDGFNLNPFVWYTRQGSDFDNHDKSRSIFFAGINATVDMLDPVVIHADFNYGTAGQAYDGSALNEGAGWIADLAVEYKMDMFTPMIFGLYETGESNSSGTATSKSKVMPNIGGGDLNFSSFGFAGSNFGGTSLYALNRLGVGDQAIGATGKMALGLKVKDIEFMDKLSHQFMVAYYKGTNDKNQTGMFTTKDNAWEVNFDTTYQMYENLAAILELGYINPSIDDADTRGVTDDSSWKAAAGFRYKF